jgi:hypothetical protein
MIASMETEKTLITIQSPFQITIPLQLERKNNILRLRETILEKATAHFILNSEMLTFKTNTKIKMSIFTVFIYHGSASSS